MDISNEVEVATIVFDETEMLEIKEVIALLFQSVDSQCGDGKEIRQKVCCNFRVSVLLLNFLVSVFVVKVARARLLRYHRKQLLICNNFVETLTIWWKMRDENDVRRKL